MKILVASDIFGSTPELRSLILHFPGETAIVSPYDTSEAMDGSEEEAYDAFLESGGLDAYTRKLSVAISERRPDALVAFSAGAGAAWRVLSSPGLSLRQAVLFYGSRIRDDLNLRPSVPARLIFAEQEKAFDVAPVIATLREQGMDAVLMPGTRHGFMNPRSPGFDALAAQAGIREIVALLSSLKLQ